MRKIEIFTGSPRKNGNSNAMVERLIDGLDKGKYACNISFLYDHEIRPCTDCRGCMKGEMRCIIEDEGQKLYGAIEKADLVVIATPIYWLGPTAQTKMLIDRLRPYYRNKRLSGKRIALLLPAASGKGDCALTIKMFKFIARALEMEYVGEATAEAFDIGDLDNDTKALESITALAAVINGVE